MRENNGLLNHILYLAQKLSDCDMIYIIIYMLGDLDTPTRPKGYEYLKTAIQCQYDDPFQYLTKSLYPTVAKMCNSKATGNQVERDMRNVIHKAWESRDTETWEWYFGSDCEECPTTGEFIAKMAEALKLWKGCSTAYKLSKKEGKE